MAKVTRKTVVYGCALRNWRMDRAMTQQEVAEKILVQYQAVCLMETRGADRPIHPLYVKVLGIPAIYHAKQVGI